MAKRLLRTLMIVLIVFLNIGCDQTTKYFARTYLKDRGTVFLLGDVLILRYVENTGGFLSLGVGLPDSARKVILIAFPLVVLSLIAGYLLRKKDASFAALTGLAFIAGGGFGNLIDRLLYNGRVGDFINIGIGRLRNPGIFNFADLSIMLGCLLLFIGELSKRTPTKS